MAETETQEAWRMRRPGYYVLNVELDVALRGPYDDWQPAVREASEINRRRLHARPAEVRLLRARREAES